MIAYLEGKLVQKRPTLVVIDVNGVGYQVQIPLSSFQLLGGENGRVRLLTYFYVREDTQQLFGFVTAQEREWFEMLLSVNGVGPKVALAILSGLPVTEIHRAVAQQNAPVLERVPGVGKKLASRLLVELKDKISKLQSYSPVSGPPSELDNTEQATLALVSLGYSRPEAKRVIDLVLSQTFQKLTMEELIRKALQANTGLRNVAK